MIAPPPHARPREVPALATLLARPTTERQNPAFLRGFEAGWTGLEPEHEQGNRCSARNQ